MGNDASPESPAGEGDNSLRNFFGGLLAAAVIVIAIMAVIEQTAS